METVTRSIITGWAWRTDRPDIPLVIEAVVNGRVIASTVADGMRQDLANAKKGSGRHGFALNFDPPLMGDVGPILRVAGDPETLLFDLQSQELLSVDISPGAASADPIYDSNVETVTRSIITGWAWRTDWPDVPLVIEAVVNGRVIASTVADGMRQDLANAKKGSGRHGFALNFDPPLMGDVGPILRVAGDPEAYLSNTLNREFASSEDGIMTAQRGSPKPRFQGGVDYVTKARAVGWAWEVGTPETRLNVEAVLDGQVIGRSTCDQYRDDLYAFDKGDGCYGFAIEYDEVSVRTRNFQIRVSDSEHILSIPETAYAEEIGPLSDLKPITKDINSFLENQYNCEAYIDVITRQSVHGWAWCPKDPEQELEIEALLNNHVIGRARANTMRTDLVQFGKGTGRYGYSLHFNKFLTGDEAPVLRVAPCDAFQTFEAPKLSPLSKNDRKQIESANIEGFFSDHMHFTQRGPEFEDVQSNLLSALTSNPDLPKPVVISFYLPQFHPIPENDRFWGKGFTEWRQLARALPCFPGHYQPRIPRDLGFYQLGGTEILRKQAKMALDAGVSAFCYYYYWFNGRKVLERPLGAHLSSDIDMPFLIMWANENWTKTWDGFEDNVLLRQDYREQDEDNLLADLSVYFHDPRYVRLGGRPLFIIYNIKHIPDVEITIKRWREKLANNHGCNPLIFMAQAFDTKDPRLFYLDGAIEFPPHKLANPHPGRAVPDAYSSEFKGRVIAYSDFAATSIREPLPEYPLIKTAVPSWDNSARRPNRGLTLEGVSPRKYQTWISDLVQRALDYPVYGSPVIAINAWNEWAEAAYLEPDVHFGAAFLNATARGVVAAVNNYAPADRRRSTTMRVTVVMPCFNHAQFLRQRIESVLQQSSPPDEVIFLDDCSSDDSVAVAKELLSKTSIPYKLIRNEKNSGGVFRQWVKGLEYASHELVWIAETDDFADLNFLSYILPAFDQDDVMAAFGYIQCVDQAGDPVRDLEEYFDGMRHFSWDRSAVVPAGVAFEYDFAVRNVIPNVSGLVFRKPKLSKAEADRLTQYSFAGDWFFYALVLRGGSLAYRHKAKSFFRINPQSASRASFFGEKHVREHQMVLEDLTMEYGLSEEALIAHCEKLASYVPHETVVSLTERFRAKTVSTDRRLHFCVVAHSFSVGGGEVLPLELANKLRSIGCHVSYVLLEREVQGPTIRGRLRKDIPLFYWHDVQKDLKGFIRDNKIDIINSHNVGFEILMSRLNYSIDIGWIVTLHGGYETVPQYINEKFVNYIQKNVDQWFFIAEKNKNLLLTKGLKDGNFVRCFNSVPNDSIDWVERNMFRSEHGIPLEAFCLVICSRAIPEKGWKTALEVATFVARQAEHDVHICMIGSGPVADEMQVSEKGNRRVHVLGHIDNPIRTLRCFDLGIFPSVYPGESFPLFLLECFEAHLPVVASDIGDIANIMNTEGEIPGAIVPWTLPQEYLVTRMADYVLRFLGDMRERERSVEAAKKTAARFHIDRLVEFYMYHSKKLVGRYAQGSEPSLDRSGPMMNH